MSLFKAQKSDAQKSDVEEKKTDEIVRKVGPYILLEMLGRGGYSWVRKGMVEKTKSLVALKFMLLADKKFLREQGKQTYTEIQAMIRIDSPYVIKLEDYNLDCQYSDKSGKIHNTILLVLEYSPGGELFDILYYTQRLGPITARTYFVQMMRGLKACHDAGVVHRDIKPQNLLLDEHFQLKVADFGLSFITQVHGDNMLRARCGTRGYQAPELLKGEKYTKSCDIFSCGVVLFILLTGHPPFEHARKTDKFYRPLCESNTEEFWRMHRKANIDDYCKDLITGMLAYKAKNRLSVDQCFQHKWVFGQIILTPLQLEALIKKRHKVCMMRKTNDKDKMQDFDKSVKLRKKRTIVKESVEELHKPLSLGHNGVMHVSQFQCDLPFVDNFIPTLMTFFAKKSLLNEAYDAAVNVFRLALRGKSKTTFNSENPWNVRTLVKVSDGKSEQVFEIALHIREIKKTGIVAFRFKRLQGDYFGFARIWDAAEQSLIKLVGTIFLDDVDKVFNQVQENKEA